MGIISDTLCFVMSKSVSQSSSAGRCVSIIYSLTFAWEMWCRLPTSKGEQTIPRTGADSKNWVGAKLAEQVSERAMSQKSYLLPTTIRVVLARLMTHTRVTCDVWPIKNNRMTYIHT
jgi:hypothetical protein